MIQFQVVAMLAKDEVMRAIRMLTFRDPDFKPGPWSIRDAEDLEAAARCIRREISYEEGRKAGSKA